jgi:hypothetical protein
MLARPETTPDLEPGLNLLWAPPRSTALHHVALSALHEVDGLGIWIDARDTASTSVLHDLATPLTLDRLRIARSWTAYQHHELVRQLPGVIDAKTDLLVLPAVASLYEDDDVPSPEDRQYLSSTLAILEELAKALDLSILMSTPVSGEFPSLVQDHADYEIEFEPTPLGYRFEAEDFETTVYWGDGWWQTTIPYWVELLGAVGEQPAMTAYEAGLVDAEV